MDIRNIIAQRAAQELEDGQVVSLGIGIPTLIANHVPPGVDVVILTPNGAIGVGPVTGPYCADPDRANAGGEPITLSPGGSYIDSATTYGVVRSGRADITFLGTFQVDSEGSMASYEVPGREMVGMGGAMDLLVGARVVNVVTQHCSKRAETRLVKKCTLPLTGTGKADVIITERAVFRRYPDRGFVLEEVARGYTLDDIAACTEMDYLVSETVKRDAYGPEPGAEE
jgi:acetate CoA/acetoacetate CoA-transferase beta subunit